MLFACAGIILALNRSNQFPRTHSHSPLMLLLFKTIYGLPVGREPLSSLVKPVQVLSHSCHMTHSMTNGNYNVKMIDVYVNIVRHYYTSQLAFYKQ